MDKPSQLEKLEKQFRKNPSSRLFFPIAEAYRNRGEYDHAVEIYRQGLANHPNYVSARVSLGRTLISMTNYDEARMELEHVARTVPDNLMAQKLLADVYMSKGDNAAAIEQFKMVLTLNPDDREAQLKIDELERAAVEQEKEETAASEPPEEVSFQPTPEETIEPVTEQAAEAEQFPSDLGIVSEALQEKSQITVPEVETSAPEPEVKPVSKASAFAAEEDTRLIAPLPQDTASDQKEQPSSLSEEEIIETKRQLAPEEVFFEAEEESVSPTVSADSTEAQKLETSPVSEEEIPAQINEIDENQTEPLEVKAIVEKVASTEETSGEAAEDDDFPIFETGDEEEDPSSEFDEEPLFDVAEENEGDSAESISFDTDNQDISAAEALFPLDQKDPVSATDDVPDFFGEEDSEPQGGDELFFDVPDEEVAESAEDDMPDFSMVEEVSSHREESATTLEVAQAESPQGDQMVEFDLGDEPAEQPDPMSVEPVIKAQVEIKEPVEIGIDTQTMAELYEQQGHLQEAAKIYRKLIDQQPDNTELRNNLENLQNKMQQVDTVRIDHDDQEKGERTMSASGKEEYINKLEQLLTATEKLKSERGK